MSRSLILLFVLLAAAVTGLAADPDAGPRAPVALLSGVRGEVRVHAASGRRVARLFDRLQAGDLLSTGDRAEAIVVFRNGTRARVTAASEARIEATGATRVRGGLDRLSAVPAMPRVAPVAGAGTTIAAVRIRADRIRLIEPRSGTTTLADDTQLRFEPVTTDEHEVTIENADGQVVFTTRIRSGLVVVPPGVLQPDTAYLWRVLARRPTGFDVRGDGRFRTLAVRDARARVEWRAALAGADADALALLAEIDWTLGLWREAEAGFRAAAAAGATDPVIQMRLSALAAPQAPEDADR